MNDWDGPPPDEHTLTLPVDRTAELALIGAVLLGGGFALENLEVGASDFFHSDTRRTFQAMLATWERGEPLDFVLIPPTDDDGTVTRVLLDAQTTAVSEYMAPAYAARVRALAEKRRLLDFAQRVGAMSLNGATPEEIIDFAQAGLEERRVQSTGWHLRSAADLAEPPEAREWLLEGLIYRGQLSMWYGPTGIRKTLLLMSMCASMAVGRNWLMRKPMHPSHSSLVTFYATRPARVLWLDYDNGEFETAIRIRAALMAVDGLTTSNVHYLSEATPWLALDNPAHVRRLIALATSIAADVIVIDALGMVLGEVDENKPEAAKIMAALKELRAATGAAILVVHHPSKAGAATAQANTYNAAGSAKFSNFFEWTIELRAGEEKGVVVAEVVKHRGWSKTRKFAAEIDYEHFGEERPDLAHELKSFAFHPVAALTPAEKRVALVQDAVTDALAGGEMNQGELVQAVREALAAEGEFVGENTVRATLKHLAAQGVIVASQFAPRQPVIYALPAPVDGVDSR